MYMYIACTYMFMLVRNLVQVVRIPDDAGTTWAGSCPRGDGARNEQGLELLLTHALRHRPLRATPPAAPGPLPLETASLRGPHAADARAGAAEAAAADMGELLQRWAGPFKVNACPIPRPTRARSHAA